MNKILKEKESSAIEFLRAMERPEGYHLAFSGGKDSCIIKHLADKETMLRMMHRAKLLHPSTYIMFMKVLTDAVNAAEKSRKENKNK